MRTIRRRVLAVLTVTLLLQAVVATAAGAAGAMTVERLAGPNRFATAVAVSQATWPGGAETAFVVTGQSFADALSVSAAAAGAGPVLLVERDRVPVETSTELRRLQPQLIVVVGGSAVVSETTRIELARYAEDATVRVAGPDRYATAAEVSKAFFPTAPERVYVASGVTFQDALAASAAAGGFAGPVLLTSPTSLPSSTASELERLAPASIVVVGDTSDVSTGVFGQIAQFGPTIRIAGADDPETSALVSLHAFASSPVAVLATGAAFPDALAGGALAGGLPVPLLLTDPNEVPDSVACELLRLGVEEVVVLGGTQAVSRTVVDQLEAGFDVGELEGCDLPITLDVPGAPLYDLVVSEDHETAYIVNNRWNRVEVLDLVERDFLDPIEVGSDPVDVDITPDGSTLYVTNAGSQDISVIDVARQQEIDRFQFPSTDGDAQVDPQRSWMLVVGQSDRAIFASTTYPGLDGGLDLWELDLDSHQFTILPVPVPPTPPTTIGGFDISLLDIVPTETGQVAELEVDGSGRTVAVGTVIGTRDEATVTVTAIETPDVEFTVTAPEQEPTTTVLSLPTDAVVRLERSDDHRYVAMSVGGSGLLVLDTSTTDLDYTTVGSRTAGSAVAELALDRTGDRILMDDGAGTAFVLDGPAPANRRGDGHRLLGTVTSQAGTSFGLALTPDGATGYRVTEAGIEVIDMDRYLVEEPCQLPLAGELAGGGGKNQPGLAQNQIALAGSGEDVTLIAVTATGVQLFLDPPMSDSDCAVEPTA